MLHPSIPPSFKNSPKYVTAPLLPELDPFLHPPWPPVIQTYENCQNPWLLHSFESWHPKVGWVPSLFRVQGIYRRAHYSTVFKFGAYVAFLSLSHALAPEHHNTTPLRPWSSPRTTRLAGWWGGKQRTLLTELRNIKSRFDDFMVVGHNFGPDASFQPSSQTKGQG